MANVAFPYRRVDEEAARADAWFIEIGEERVPLQSYVADWDYNTDLHLSAEIAVDTDAVRKQARLADDALLALTVSCFSKTTYLRECVFRKELPDGKFAETIAVDFPGRRLAGTLVIDTKLVLAAPHAQQEAFSAHLPGSILWEKRDETRLQGDAPLFPISVVAFPRAGFPPAAPWKLVVSGSAEHALLGSIRLYVNADHPIVVDAFRATSPRPEDERVLSAAYADVARTFVEHALADYESIPAEPDPDSLGFAYKTLIENLFPGESVDTVRDRWTTHPGDFGADVLAKVRLFNG